MKRHAFERYQRTHNPERLAHRHVPTLSHWAMSAVWSFMHLLMPWMIHSLTDKYEQKKHPWRHVVVDTIFAATVLTLLFLNMAIALWAYLYFTPAGIDVRVQTNAVVVSGMKTDVIVTYANPYRDIENVQMYVELPEGFVATLPEEHEHLELQLGHLDTGVVKQVPISGVVFGDVGQQYTVKVVTTYEYLGRMHEEMQFHHFSVKGSSLTVETSMDETVVYGRETVVRIGYENQSPLARTNVEVEVQVPRHFIVTGVEQSDRNFSFDRNDDSTGVIRIDRIESEEKGELLLKGYFSAARRAQFRLVGDQETEFAVTIRAGVASRLVAADRRFTQAVVYAGTNVVNPRADITLAAARAIHFGEVLEATITVRNIGDTPMTNIALFAAIDGKAQQGGGRVSIRRGSTQLSATSIRLAQAGRGIALPQIDALAPGESARLVLTLPTQKISDQQVKTMIRVTGTVYAPEIKTTIPLLAASTETRFHSQVDLHTQSLYHTADGEQIGYGPYPSKPNQVTSYRELFALANINNPLKDVRVTATLSNQVQWTDFYSVSAGTRLQYDKNTRQVTWFISSLAPQSQKYGSQFELLFTPNTLQIGKKPDLIHSIRLTATDAFTGERFERSIGPITVPAAVAK